MRILLLGVAAVTLSGCSWLGGTKSQGVSKNSHGYYTGAADNGCCKTLSKWNLEAAAGPEFVVGGKLLTPDETHSNANVQAQTLSMKEAFDPGMRYELGGSYALNPNRKVTLMGSYAKANGEQINLGTIGGDVVTGRVSDYERYGVEAGLRQYIGIKKAPLVKSIRPYVEGKVGAAKVKDITLQNAQRGAATLNGGTVGLYEGGWVPSAAGMIGVETPVFKRATLGLETGIRYTGKLKSDTSYLDGGQPLAGINNGSDSWTVPVTLRGRYRF